MTTILPTISLQAIATFSKRADLSAVASPIYMLGALLISISCIAIAVMLLSQFAKTSNTQLKVLFGAISALLLLVGATRIISVVAVWTLIEFEYGILNFVAGISAAFIAMLMKPIIAELVKMPTLRMLSETNERLSGEVAQRRSVERDLRQRSEELERTNENLLEAIGAHHASEERLALAVEASQIGLWDWDIKSKKIWFSPRCLEILGYRPDEPVFHYSYFEESLHPEDRASILESLTTHLETGARYNRQFRMRRKSGKYLWLEAFGKAQRDRDGVPVRMSGTMIDISASKQAQSDLERSEAFQGAVLENVRDGIVACDQNGVLVLFNRAAREFHGVDAEPICEVEWAKKYNLYEGDGTTTLQVDRIPLVRALKGEIVSAQEMVIAPKDRPKRLLLVYAAPLTDRSGQRIGAVAVMHDVTRERAALADLRRSKRELELIFDHAGVELWCKNAENRIIRINKRAADAIGLTVEAVEGRRVDELPLDEVNAAMYADRTVLSSGAAQFEIIERLARASGEARWLKTDRVPYTDEETGERLLLVASSDITETVIAKEELKRSNEELEQFARVASHDLQEPLRKIIVFSEFLIKDVGGGLPPEARTDLDMIVSAARRMQGLIRNILTLATTDGAAWKLGPTDPKACIDMVIGQIQPSIEKRIRFEVATLPWVLAEPAQLSQIYQNLISNALKFTRPNSETVVSLTGEWQGDSIILGVRDNGIGVPEEFRERIFEPLTRIHARDAYEGNGIGLAICKKAVERMGGRIWVENTPGGGAHFRFSLKAAPAAAATASVGRSPE